MIMGVGQAVERLAEFKVADDVESGPVVPFYDIDDDISPTC